MSRPSADPEAGTSVELKGLSSQASSSASPAGEQPTKKPPTVRRDAESESLSASFVKVLFSPCTDLVRKDRYELAESFKDTMISSLPPQGSVDSDDLERTGYALHIAVAFQATFLFFLLFIGVSDYEYNKKAEFLSPSLSEGNCETVPATVRNGYYADKYGYWDSESQFLSSTSINFVSFSGAPVNTQEYTAAMNGFKATMLELADRGVERDLAFTLASLSSFRTGGIGTALGMKYHISPDILFDYITGEYGISDMYGDCIPFGDTPIRADYDRVSKSIIFRIKVYNGTKDAQPCSQFYAQHLYINQYSYDSEGILEVAFDIRSVMTAIGVNRGIVKVKRDLRPLFSDLFNVTVYTDPAYGDMPPIYCTVGLTEDDPDSCFVISANYYPLYPSMAQLGGTRGNPCTCPYNKSNFDYDECNTNNMMISLSYVNIPSAPPGEDPIQYFNDRITKYRVDNPEYGDINATEVVRLAHISALPVYFNTTLADRKEPFTTLCGKYNCTLFHIQLYGETGFTNVNDAGTQLSEYFSDRDPGACKYALYNDAAFSPLIDKPPTSLEESYYVCRTPATTAFQRAVGVAAGSATLYSSIALSVMVFLLVRGFNMRNRSDPIVEPDEKRRRAETRMSMMEINAAEQEKRIERLTMQCTEFMDANARLLRQNDDLAKALLQLRNEVIGLKVDVARVA